MDKILILVLLLCLWLPQFGDASEPYFEETANLSDQQKESVEKLRSLVEAELPHDYMKRDLYLVRFLKLHKWKVEESAKGIRKMIEWRKSYKVDEIHTEDFTDMEDEFPLFMDGVDKQGRVIMEGPTFGRWHISKHKDKLDKLKRYGTKAIENVTTQVRALQEGEQGKNVSNWVMLLNLDGYSTMEGSCDPCKKFYSHFTENYERYYPFSVGLIVLINTPKTFDIILNFVRPMMHEQTRNVLKIFDSNEKKWKPFIQEHFDLEQIAEEFGGGKKRETVGTPDSKSKKGGFKKMFD